MKKTLAIIGTVSILLLASLFLSVSSQSQTVNMGRTYVSSQNVRYANNGGTGTTLNKLAKLTGAPSTAILTTTTDTSGIVGIVVAGAGTTGSADIAFKGKALCAFDSATTAGHYVTNDTSTAGDCMDAGATYPTSGQVIGIVTSTNGGAGTYEVDLTLGQPQAGGGGGPSGTGLLVLPNSALSSSSSWQSYTIWCRFAGSELLNLAPSWKVTIRFTAGSPVIGNMVMLRTLRDSLAVVDSTAVTIGGVSNPTLVTPTVVTTDAIAVALDVSHDYWLGIYFNNDAANAGVSLAGVGGVISHITAFSAGDQTGAVTIPGLNYTYIPLLYETITP